MYVLKTGLNEVHEDEIKALMDLREKKINIFFIFRKMEGSTGNQLSELKLMKGTLEIRHTSTPGT